MNRKFPEPVALVTCSGNNGKDNVITVGWFMQTSIAPVLLAISIGKMRFSHDLLLNAGEFVLCFPSPVQSDAVVYCGTHSGRDIDKFTKTDLMKIPARHVRAPLIAGSIASFECRVVDSFSTSDHTIFVGEVLTAYVSESKEKSVLYDYGSCILKGLL